TASGQYKMGSGSSAAVAAAPAPSPSKKGHLVPIIALLAVLAIAGGVIGYVRHSQAQQRAEIEKLLKEKEQPVPAQTTAPANATPPAPSPAALARVVPEPPPATEAKETPKPSAPVPVTPKKKDSALPATVDVALASTPAGAKVQIDGKGDA